MYVVPIKSYIKQANNNRNAAAGPASSASSATNANMNSMLTQEDVSVKANNVNSAAASTESELNTNIAINYNSNGASQNSGLKTTASVKSAQFSNTAVKQSNSMNATNQPKHKQVMFYSFYKPTFINNKRC